MTTPPAPTVESLARAVEEAWDRSIKEKLITSGCVLRAVENWLAARRAARDAGLVPVLVSREILDSLAAWVRCTWEEDRRTGEREIIRCLVADLAPYFEQEQP